MAIDLYKLLRLFCTGIFSRFRPAWQSISLPSRHRKGNLLTSLSVLFTAIIEQLTECRQVLLTTGQLQQLNLPFREKTQGLLHAFGKLLRISLLLISWLLVMLALFEWSPLSASPARPVPVTETLCSRSEVSVTGTASALQIVIPAKLFFQLTYAVNVLSADIQVNEYPGCFPLSAKRWLLLRVLRI